MTAFHEFLIERLDRGGFTTEDALAVFLPLVRQVVETHELGFVAPLDGVEHLQVDGNRVWFAEADRREIVRSDDALRHLHPMKTRAVEVIGEVRHEIDLDEGSDAVEDLAVGSSASDLVRPVFLPGYRSYEHALSHHDPLTDTFVLGLILASFCLGLDLGEEESLRRFVSNRDNLFRIQPDLHPVIAKVIRQMTELSRELRPQDLVALADGLADYRELGFDIELDLLRESGFHQKDLHGRHQIILSKLQQRLFEISRRNRLLHYRQTQQTVNLTNASVPLSFDPESIREEQILTWSGKFRAQMCAGKKILLNSYLNFEEALYLPSLLDKIRAEARKDQAEFGFAQLRLVICFLRWSNLKEDEERYDSPLLLLPVRLTKKKGVRDGHHLEPLSSEAEVNPVLRYYFRELYGIQLPESVDLETADLADLHRLLEQQIRKSESAVALEWIEKPRISLIHRRARQRLDQFQKRSRMARRGTRTYPALDYSYRKSDFRPLGLQLFRQKVQVGEADMEGLVVTTPRRRSQSAVPANDGGSAREAGRSLFSLETAGGDNPYRWEFDLCSVTLGNFKYRKMSLVRDYESLLDELPQNGAFDSVFSLTPAPAGLLPDLSMALADRHPVVACDPTQSRAIAYAAEGQSFIIQGPPGTGKSQTIANLIADYVARGKRVLFVCEKRAAIDVVYHRLEQRGLGSLCCLVHDAQSDKKKLIADLRESYEEMTDAAPVPSVERDRVLASVEQDLDPLLQNHAAMIEPRQPLGQDLRSTLVRALELQEASGEMSAVESEGLPRYRHWSANRERLGRFYTALTDAEPTGIYRNHPLRLLRADLVDTERAASTIQEFVEPAVEQLGSILETIRPLWLPEESVRDLLSLRTTVEFAGEILEWAGLGKIALLNAGSEVAKDCEARIEAFRACETETNQAVEKSAAWREPLPESELENAIAQAKLLESSFFAFCKPAWWRLRRVMRRCFDFDRGVVRPTWSQALASLEQRYAWQGELATVVVGLRADLGFAGDVASFLEKVERLRRDDLAAKALRGHLLASGSATDEVRALAGILDDLERLEDNLQAVLQDFADVERNDLFTELRGILDNLDALPEFGHCLAEMRGLPPDLVAAIRTKPWDAAQLEAALIEAGLFSELRRDRRINRFDGRQRDRVAGQLEKHYDEWLTANALALRERVRGEFLADHALITAPEGQLSEAEKATKKAFAKGLKELQHEFKKTRRYKSIRDLSAGDSGVVVQQLKPVWLMSPLSVSDTLPMAADRFDVVIFDEASQITLEEAVPAIFRAAQIIVVGDEMQLPPTDFFSARRTADECGDGEGEDAVEYDLDSNSFLTHAARNLRSCMLGWHYRSRSESLISFSNQAFYQGDLLTVPDEGFAAEPRPEIVVRSVADATANVDRVLARPVGFHFIEGGIYDARRNRPEAEYIASLVREMLTRDVGLSIGVVAFSQAQQGEIEEALERLGDRDHEFRETLEVEYEREQEGQFVGLLVKNLENIQGDERDVVILSVCYGSDPLGNMRMNFGPINKSGGEKRLNVAFSRAKQHMVLVSSIRSTAITNDYNVGANCLKEYLRYAEVSSIGDAGAAARVLHQVRGRAGEGPKTDSPRHPLATLLGTALVEAGFRVDFDVGQSTFRCDLAVCKPGESKYSLGILLDADAYFAEPDALERDMMKPRLLRNFGWTITHVLTKDWHADPPAELQRILSTLCLTRSGKV